MMATLQFVSEVLVVSNEGNRCIPACSRRIRFDGKQREKLVPALELVPALVPALVPTLVPTLGYLF